MLAKNPTKPQWESTPAEVRAGASSKWKPEYLGVADPVAKVEYRYISGPTAELPMKIYTPEGIGPFPAVVFFHGGGWVAGNIELNAVQHQQIAHDARAVVVAVNYQKAPEHKFPIPFDDCYATLEWVHANAAELNINVEEIGVAGDSAGGNLAAGVALRNRDQKLFPIAYQLLIYPCLGLDFETDSYNNNAVGYGLSKRTMSWLWSLYLTRPKDDENPYAVPLNAQDLVGLPETIIITAEHDVLREDGARYVDKLQSAGVPVTYIDYEGMIHGFFNYGKFIDAGISSRIEIAELITEALA